VGASRQTLREQGRKQADERYPTVAIIDSQSAKTALKGAARLRCGKKIKVILST